MVVSTPTIFTVGINQCPGPDLGSGQGYHFCLRPAPEQTEKMPGTGVLLIVVVVSTLSAYNAKAMCVSEDGCMLALA